MNDLPVSSPPPVPITVLCGFLGAGKTTLLNALLSQQSGKRVAVIVNEFGAVNIDASLVVHTGEQITELSNGCICCTLRGDLLEAVDSLLRTRTLDAILIESTGIGEPLPIAQSFCLTPEELGLDPELPNLIGRVYVDAMVTVVDSAQFFTLWHREDAIAGDDLGRGYGELLAEQIEFADLVILNKQDLADPADTSRLRELVKLTNPQARLLETTRGQIDVSEVLDVRLFDVQRLRGLDSWTAELAREHTPESETYGLSSYIYHRTQPFGTARLHRALAVGLPHNIIRSKGWVRLSGDHPGELPGEHSGGESADGSEPATLWNHTGRQLALERAGYWLDSAQAVTEIVFIGPNLDPAAIDALLDSALIVGSALPSVPVALAHSRPDLSNKSNHKEVNA